MKAKFIIAALSIGLISLVAAPKAEAQVSTSSSYAGYLGVLDTLTNADTTTYTVSVKGKKSTVSFGVNVTKISGTVGGSINIYGSVDGTNYSTAALTTTTITNATANYGTVYTSNGYQKYKVVVIGASGGVCSQRTYLLYRD